MKAIVYVADALFAAGLAFLLIRKPQFLTQGAYKWGFFLALAAFAAIVLSPSAEFSVHLGQNPGAPVVAILTTLLFMTPFVLLIEAGILGYRAFSSWIRYLSLLLAVVGAVGVVASLLLPRLASRMR